MFSCVETGTAAVGCETACCRSGLCRRVETEFMDGLGLAADAGVEDEEDDAVAAIAPSK